MYDSFLGTDRKGHTINLQCRLQLSNNTFSLESNDPIRFSTWVWEIKLQQRHTVQMKEWKKVNFGRGIIGIKKFFKTSEYGHGSLTKAMVEPRTNTIQNQ